MRRIACLFLGVLFVLSACVNANKTTVNNEEVADAEEGKTGNDAPKVEFQETVNLTYSPVPLLPLEERDPDESLEYLHSFSIGSIQDKEATLHVYKEHDESKRCGLNYETISFVEFNQRIHQLPECTSTNFLNQDPNYSLQLYQLETSSSKVLQAGIELAANGAGRTLFLVYDQTEEQWLSFENWGVPVFNDSDQQYTDSYIFSFPGLHMRGSDIAFFRWTDGNLEASGPVTRILGISDNYFVQAALAPSEPEIVIDVTVTTEDGSEFKEQYKYEDDKLLKNSS